jgi:hypothetical protein
MRPPWHVVVELKQERTKTTSQTAQELHGFTALAFRCIECSMFRAIVGPCISRSHGKQNVIVLFLRTMGR